MEGADEKRREKRRDKDKEKRHRKSHDSDKKDSGWQKLEGENSKLKEENSELGKKLEQAEARERNKDTRIALLMRELEKLEARVRECQEDCKEWEQIDRERDKTVLSLQQTVSLLQRDLETITNKQESNAKRKKERNTNRINFVPSEPEKHEYPPETPSDSDGDSDSNENTVTINSDEEGGNSDGDDGDGGDESEVIRHKSNYNGNETISIEQSISSFPSRTLLGLEASTDIFAMMVTTAPAASVPQVSATVDSHDSKQRAPSTNKNTNLGFSASTDIFSMMARPDKLNIEDEYSSSSSEDELRSPSTVNQLPNQNNIPALHVDQVPVANPVDQVPVVKPTSTQTAPPKPFMKHSPWKKPPVAQQQQIHQILPSSQQLQSASQQPTTAAQQQPTPLTQQVSPHPQPPTPNPQQGSTRLWAQVVASPAPKPTTQNTQAKTTEPRALPTSGSVRMLRAIWEQPAQLTKSISNSNVRSATK